MREIDILGYFRHAVIFLKGKEPGNTVIFSH